MAEEPLIKVLTGAGIGSRRKVADLIRAERVVVNGKLATGFNLPVAVGKDKVTVDGRPVPVQAEKPVYLLLHKPKDVLATAYDERGRRTVLHLLPARYRQFRLYPVGRLDKDSTGLLLLTNDGDLTYRLTHPKYELEKEYLVQIQGVLSPAEKERLQKGVVLEDGKTGAAVVRGVVGTTPNQYSLTVHEGKKRQVRRMFAAVGHHVLALQRVRLGSLDLGGLEEGKVRELTPAEVRRLRDNP